MRQHFIRIEIEAGEVDIDICDHETDKNPVVRAGEQQEKHTDPALAKEIHIDSEFIQKAIVFMQVILNELKQDKKAGL